MAKNIDLPDGSTGLVIASIDKDGKLKLLSSGDPAVSVSAEITNSPTRNYLPWTGTSSAVVATAIYISPDVSGYNVHTFEAVTDVAKVKASVDGTNWSDVAVLVDGVLSATIAAGKIGVLEGKYKAVALHPNAATATNGRGAHGVQ